MLPHFDATPSRGDATPVWATERESVLIMRAKAGDPEAMSALYERYAPQIQRYIAARLSDPVLAEDVCADVFVKVLESLDRYEDRGWPFSAWLYRIAFARTVDVLRQSSRRPAVSLDEMHLGTLDPPDEVVINRLAYQEAKGAMDVLTSEQQLVLRLRFDEDRSLSEIAQSLGRSIGSIKALQHRGLSRLAQELGSHSGPTVAAM